MPQGVVPLASVIPHLHIGNFSSGMDALKIQGVVPLSLHIGDQSSGMDALLSQGVVPLLLHHSDLGGWKHLG